MSAGYVIARENFKEAAKHVSAETDPVMFNLLYGLQSLAVQLEADFAALTPPAAPAAGKAAPKRGSQKSAVAAAPRHARKKAKTARAKTR